MILTEISPTAGNGTGVPSETGSVSESLLAGYFDTQERCLNPVVYRLDRSTGSLNIIEDTVNAVSTSANVFTPFNSNGDEIAINCEEDFQGVLMRIDTVSNNASGVITVKDSIDGVWASNALAVTDNTNKFKSSGWHYITIPDNAARKEFKFSNDPTFNTPPGKYITIGLSGMAVGEIYPKISNIILIRKNLRYDDHTTSANGDTAVAPAEDTHYPWTASAKVWGFANIAYGMEVYMHLATTNVITDVHEYFASDNTWKTLNGWVNGTNDFTVGPANLGDPVQKLPIRWTPPADWAKKSKTFTLDNGSTVTIDAYWIQMRTLTVTSYGPKINPRFRLRSRQFGSANTTSIKPLVATTIRGVRILSTTISNTTALEMECANVDTGKSSAFTIPINPVFPQNYDFTDVSVLANEGYFLICKSGGTLRNTQCEFIL